MSDKSITPALSESDLLELISLKWKVKHEGSLRYTLENWTWLFDDRELNEAAAAGRPGPINLAALAHAGEIVEWERAHREDGADLINAHRDRQDARREAGAGA